MNRTARAQSIRSRPVLMVIGLLVVAAGLASRRFPDWLPSTWGQYPGDALWGVMVLLLIAWVRPTVGSLRLAIAALGVCYVVEFSQLYQAPWINAIRATGLGHLALGSAFNPLDLVAYAIGVATGFAIDRLLLGRMADRQSRRNCPGRDPA